VEATHTYSTICLYQTGGFNKNLFTEEIVIHEKPTNGIYVEYKKTGLVKLVQKKIIIKK
jgi:hypothetical protein